ncbi:MAG: single-stranded DNA-binding protein [Muribaculaceae bacterium]|nr:single-stranded DNA-binding protein [Muribaculaceae bacterium]
MSVNKVILLGNVGREPEVRYVAQNQPMATFSLATTEHAFTNANGVQVPERTEWHNIVMWGRNAEVAERYVHKGTQLYIEGRLHTRSWEDRNQIKRYVTEVYVDTFELLGRPRSAEEQQPAQQPQQPASQPQQPQQ